jgi:hypothetical protein
MTAGFAFDGFDTGGNSGFVNLVAFLTIRTGDFHLMGSGFRGSRFRVYGFEIIISYYCNPIKFFSNWFKSQRTDVREQKTEGRGQST